MADHASDKLPGVVARELSPELQRKVWNHLKRTHPAMAEALKEDPFIARLRAEMGASPVFAAGFVREAKRT